MTRSPVGVAIIAILCIGALYGAGVISWHPTAWERGAAHSIAKDAGRAAKAVGVKVHIPPRPPGVTPAPKTTTQATTGTRSTTTLYPTPSGQAVPAPTAAQSITSAYCQIENIPAGTDGCP